MGLTRTSVPYAKQVELPDMGAPVQLRRHAGARRMTLRLSRTRGALIVTAPPQCDGEALRSFLEKHKRWVRERLDTLPGRVPFEHGAVVPLRGTMHRIVASAEASRAGVVSRLDGALGPELRVRGNPEHLSRRVTDWLVREALRDLDASVVAHGRALGLSAKRITVRDQASRWGSCSTTGALSFSWRLIMAPPMILDYVAAHEVAHLAEMNHGPRFWALVRKAMPGLDEARQWLKLYGLDLHRYGPERA